MRLQSVLTSLFVFVSACSSSEQATVDSVPSPSSSIGPSLPSDAGAVPSEAGRSAVEPGDAEAPLPFVTVRVDGPRAAGDVRVGVVWMNIAPDGRVSPDKTLSSVSSVAVPTLLPANVRLPLAPPPREARAGGGSSPSASDGGAADGGAQGTIAVGRLVAFVDVDGDGILDLTEASTATGFAETIVGYVGSRVAGEDGGSATQTLSIAHVEGVVPIRGTLAGAPLGFSVYESRSTGPGAPNTRILPVTTVVPLKLLQEPKLSCAAVSPWPSGTKGGDGLDNVIAAPATTPCPGNVPLVGATATCIAPGLNVYISQVTRPASPFVVGACGPVLERCVVLASPTAVPGQPMIGAPPAGWPCP